MLLEEGLSLLRTEEESIQFCKNQKFNIGATTTKNQDHHQSSKSLIAAVSNIAANICNNKKITITPDPQNRCIWSNKKGLHITARNLDGAIPGLENPIIVWEIKEYWGKTKGGSKMSDAVYECHLVGREIRVFEAKSDIKIQHIVFIDGKEQWSHRKSDLARFIDLTNQGIIDLLFIGRDVETEWENYLVSNL